MEHSYSKSTASLSSEYVNLLQCSIYSSILWISVSFFTQTSSFLVNYFPEPPISHQREDGATYTSVGAPQWKSSVKEMDGNISLINKYSFSLSLLLATRHHFPQQPTVVPLPWCNVATLFDCLFSQSFGCTFSEWMWKMFVCARACGHPSCVCRWKSRWKTLPNLRHSRDGGCDPIVKRRSTFDLLSTDEMRGKLPFPSAEVGRPFRFRRSISNELWSGFLMKPSETTALSEGED